LTQGLVTASHRRNYTVRLDDGAAIDCVIRGRSLAVACGDRVVVASPAAGTSVIESILPRTTLFFRSDAYNEKLLAANVTQVLGIVAPDPPYDEELVSRWIIAAESNNCRFVLIANKHDLPGFAAIESRIADYAALGYTVVTLSAQQDATSMRRWVAGQRSILVGQSGMGKSTLINALVPDADARVGALSAALETGRHTTSETILYPLEGDAWIVDSPGMNSFGLAHLSADAIEQAFIELRPLRGRCRFRDCRHDAEPGCVVQDAVARGDIRPWRLGLLHQLLHERERRARAR
jgi:ribosome biogenesis GTPase